MYRVPLNNAQTSGEYSTGHLEQKVPINYSYLVNKANWVYNFS